MVAHSHEPSSPSGHVGGYLFSELRFSQKFMFASCDFRNSFLKMVSIFRL